MFCEIIVRNYRHLEQKILNPIKWSYSSLSTFKQCPRKYYHTKVAKDVVEPMSQAMLYGNRVHKAAEEYVRDGKPIEEAFLYIKEFIDSILDSFKGQVFCEQRLGLTVELKPCRFSDKDVWYRGIVDLLIIDGENKEALIVDYKTGKNAKYADTGQLELMALAVFKHYPDVETIKAGLYFFTKTQLIKVQYNKDSQPDLWAKWLQDISNLENCYENEVWNPKPNFTCAKYCPVKSCEHNGRN